MFSDINKTSWDTGYCLYVNKSRNYVKMPLIFLPADHQNMTLQERLSCWNLQLVLWTRMIMLFSSPLRSFTFLHLFTEQKENCKLIHKGLAFLSTSSLVLIDCSGIPLSTREGFVCAKETIQEGRKFFFAYLTICCVAVHSCQQLVKNTFYKEIF